MILETVDVAGDQETEPVRMLMLNYCTTLKKEKVNFGNDSDVCLLLKSGLRNR